MKKRKLAGDNLPRKQPEDTDYLINYLQPQDHNFDVQIRESGFILNFYIQYSFEESNIEQYRKKVHSLIEGREIFAPAGVDLLPSKWSGLHISGSFFSVC